MIVLILKGGGQLELDLSRADINHEKPPKQNLNPTVLCVCLLGLHIYVYYKYAIIFYLQMVLSKLI